MQQGHPRLSIMRVRELTVDDNVAYRSLSAGAFGGGFEAVESRPFSAGETAIGIGSEQLPGGAPGVVAAGARIRHDRITLGGGVVDCGGISGLAVHPAHRGDGLFRELIAATIARCAQEQLPMSMLYPSHPAIYRRAGYQVVASVQRLLVPIVDLQHLPKVPDRRLVPVTGASMPRLHGLYRELTAEDNGMLTREGPLFPAGLPSGGWSALLLEDHDGVAHGYVSWTRTAGEDGGAGLEVHEILGRTREDRLALLRSLGSWSTVTESVVLRVRTEDPVLDVLPGSGARPVDGLPLVMMRVIDTAAAFEARRAPAGLAGAVRLVVEDDTVPEGTCRSAGSWLLSAADGRVAASPDEGSAPEDGSIPGDTGVPDAASSPGGDAAEVLGTARWDIHAAGLLLMGGRTLADARRLGLSAIADPAAEQFLDALLAGPRPSVLDAF